jgi:hypothetical protein
VDDVSAAIDSILDRVSASEEAFDSSKDDLLRYPLQTFSPQVWYQFLTKKQHTHSIVLWTKSYSRNYGRDRFTKSTTDVNVMTTTFGEFRQKMLTFSKINVMIFYTSK